MRKSVALLLIISTPAFGDINVVHLLQGQASPFEGYLFTVPAESKLRLTDMQLSYEQNLNLSLTAVNSTLHQEVSVMQDRINNQDAEIKELSSHKDGFLGKVGCFLMGAALASLVAYGASRAVK